TFQESVGGERTEESFFYHGGVSGAGHPSPGLPYGGKTISTTNSGALPSRSTGPVNPSSSVAANARASTRPRRRPRRREAPACTGPLPPPPGLPSRGSGR